MIQKKSGQSETNIYAILKKGFRKTNNFVHNNNQYVNLDQELDRHYRQNGYNGRYFVTIIKIRMCYFSTVLSIHVKQNDIHHVLYTQTRKETIGLIDPIWTYNQIHLKFPNYFMVNKRFE